MANIKTTNLLPQVFRTDTNQKFLNATLDQLVSKPELKKINGYIGRVFAPTTKFADTYLTEENALRQNYQMEPAVVVKNDSGETQFHGSYIDLLNQIQYLGGDITNHDRLFANESYSYDGLIDLDKIVNFNQYYWLPNGPDPVDVRPTGTPTTESYTVTRDAVTGTYKFSNYGGAQNPQMVLAKGGVYQFKVNQPGNPFWIQSEPGLSGFKKASPTNSSREVLGVVNNGIDVGTITWRVPGTGAQDQFAKMRLIAQIDYAVPAAIPFSKFQNRKLDLIIKEGIGFDGGTHNLSGKKCIFLADVGVTTNWTIEGVFDLEAWDTVKFESSGEVVYEQRASIWTINLVPDAEGELVVKLVDPQPLTKLTQKVAIKNGVINANKEFWLDREDRFQIVPNMTAQQEILYYQDGTSGNFVGRFKLIEPVNSVIDIENEIVGKPNYKSPNDIMFTNGLKVKFDTGVIPNTYVDREYYVEGVGTAIKLVPVEQLKTIEDFEISYPIIAGTGYKINDILTVVGGTFDTAATLRVETIEADTATALSSLNQDSLYSVGITATGSGYQNAPTLFVANSSVLIGDYIYTALNRYYKVTKSGTLATTPPSHTDGTETIGTANLLFVSEASIDLNPVVTVEEPPVGELFAPRRLITVGKYLYTATGQYYEVVQSGALGATPPSHTEGIADNGFAKLKYIVRTPARVSATVENGRVTQLTIDEAGAGYKNAPRITIEPPTSGGVKEFKVLNPGKYSVYPDNTVYVTGGHGINAKLRVFLTPEIPDYVTINRGSMDRNAWTRRNRWFHVDVINATSNYLQTVPVAPQEQRAKRPVIEFDPDIQLFNHGAVGRDACAYIDFENINQVMEVVEGFPTDNSETAVYDMGNYDIILAHGDRIVFAADADIVIRQQIYVINIVNINGESEKEDWRVHLVPDPLGQVLAGTGIVTNKGLYKNKIEESVQYWFDGSTWHYGQKKTTNNQFPLFEMVTENNVSLSDVTLFQNSTFAGTELFSYKIGTGSTDSVLGFPLSYRSVNNIGDIEFQNDFDYDTFDYESQGKITQSINKYYLRQNLGYDSYKLRNVWTKNADQTKQYQVFNYKFTGESNYFPVDVLPAESTQVPTIAVYVNNRLLPSSSYAVAKSSEIQVVRISISELEVGDVIAIRIYSKSISRYGFYEIPQSLDLNSINSNFQSLTLGQMRNHLVSMYRHSTFVTGDVPGPSNLRDVRVKQQGGSILQHASPVIYSNLFLLDKDINFVKGIEYAQKEYSKFKNKFLEISITQDIIDIYDIPASVDAIMQSINRVKNSKFPWYYSDMVPYGSNKNTLKYVVLNPQLRRYELESIFNDTVLSNRAVIVYYYTTKKDRYGNMINKDGDIVRRPEDNPIITGRRQLTKDQDFVFEQDRPAIRLLDDTAQLYNDMIVIEDYVDTDGGFVPETPSKLGLYPKFEPRIYVDSTYLTPTTVIQGHDGSITPAFGDYRDDLLLELELRIYNNIKMNYRTSLIDIYDLIPGKFRDTDYTLTEYNSILTQRFLKWVGGNKTDYSTNKSFNSNNPYTWNYKNFKDTVDGEFLPGSWRATYKYFFDTDRPHTHPWEMLGFSDEPAWWEARYGVAPFTGGNFVLWEDLRDGYIFGENRYDTKFARPDLLKIIPVDDAGVLRSPEQFLVADFNSAKAGGSFSVGDMGPVENAWRRSSEFPFALQLVFAVAKPGYYFGSLVNIDCYSISTNTAQHALENNSQRITPTEIHINGKLLDGTIERTAGYINWIGDYLTNLGLSSPGVRIKDYLKGLSVRLSYKVAGFVDKKYIKVIAEQSSPSSTTASVIVPDENYEIYMNKSSVIKKINYSAVLVQKSNAGWTVSGYDVENPFFTIIPSLANNNFSRIEAGKATGIIYQDFQNYKIKVPYGFEFTTRQQVIDFLVSYGRFLTGQGMRFTEWNTDLQKQQDFTLSALEFLTWAQQGWRTGSLLVLSPAISQITVNSPNGFVDEIENSANGTKILDQNFVVIKNTQFTVIRNGAEFRLKANAGQTICFAALNIVQYEHALIFDNTTLFNDVIYMPELGNRQYRLKLVGSKTGSWNGQLDIPGFIYGTDKVDAWQVGTDYRKGALVSYKNNFYTAINNLIAKDFDPADWKRIEADQIKTGLLPNFSQNAQLLDEIYDINSQPKNKEIAKFSNSLIGFRERGYFTDLGLDLETQTKFYTGYIKQKGTKAAVDALSAVQLGNLNSTLNTYEEWAIRVGGYGSIDSNEYVEITLDESQFKEDPTTFLLSANNEPAPDQIISVPPTQLWRRPNNYNPRILNDLTRTIEMDKPITAGYVNFADIDTTIFDIRDYRNLDSVISSVGSGFKVWVAKDFDDDWNVYRVSETNNFVIAYEYSLNGLVKITTFDPHGFAEGNIIALKGFDTDFDGFYRVFGIEDNNAFYVTVNRNEALIQEVQAVFGTGLVFLLTSLRSPTKNGITTLEPPNYWKEGDTLWVDNDRGEGEWSVYQKTAAWTANGSPVMADADYVTGSEYGTVVKFNSKSTIAIATSPGTGSSTTGIKVFTRPAGTTQFFKTQAFSTLTPHAEDYGRSADIGSSVAAIGAPGSLSNKGLVILYDYGTSVDSGYIQTLQVPAGVVNDKFGYSVSISRDDKWLYVGAPGANKVYVYGQTNYTRQSTTITGKTGIYVQQGTTLVTVEMQNHGYVTGNTANLNIISGSGSSVRSVSVTRVDEDTFEFTASSSITTTGTLNIADYNVGFVPDNKNYLKVISENRIYMSDLDFTVYGTNVMFNTNCQIGTDTITVAEGKYYRLMSTLSAPAGYTGQFGYAVKTGTEGAQLVVGAPDATVNGLPLAGAAAVYDRLKEGFYTNGTQNTFAPERSLATIYQVTLDGIVQVEDTDYVIINSNIVKFNSLPESGKLVEIEINDFNLVKVLGAEASVAKANSAFGRAVDLCPNNCSIYIGAPQYSTAEYFAGRVYRYVNRGQIYGSTITNIAEPFMSVRGNYSQTNSTVTLTTEVEHELKVGDTVTVNFTSGNVVTGIASIAGSYVISAVPNTSTIQYETEEFITTDGFFEATSNRHVNIVNVGDSFRINGVEVNVGGEPIALAGSFVVGATYVIRSVGNTNFMLIGAAANLVGTSFVATGAGTEGETGTAYRPTQASILEVADAINTAEVPGVTATVVNGQLSIVSEVVVKFRALSILPASGTVLDDIDLDVYPVIQAIEHPYRELSEYFGSSLRITDTADSLFVSSKGADTRIVTSIDELTTTFDSDTTRFADFAVDSGTVYVFDYFSIPNDSFATPGQFSFVQQISPDSITSQANFGCSIDVSNGYAVIGASNDSMTAPESGEVYIFVNPTNRSAWQLLKQSEPKVDYSSIYRTFAYSATNQIIHTNFDIYDPAKGKILGLADQDIDYMTSYDPARYNQDGPTIDVNTPADGAILNVTRNAIGTAPGWGKERVGEYWWNLDAVRYIDYEQGSLTYRARNWGRRFPGSVIEVCEWIESDVRPENYTGPGTAKYVDGTQYSIAYFVDKVSGIVKVKYYYWVVNPMSVIKENSVKTMSAGSVADMIENPQNSGAAYMAPIRHDAFNLYGVARYLSGTDTKLNISYSLIPSQGIIHNEFELIAENSGQSYIPEKIIRKLQDSLTGMTVDGYLVPDPAVPVSQRYGISSRPRQSIFINRAEALRNFVGYVNQIFATKPVLREFDTQRLYSQEAQPREGTDAWDMKTGAWENLDYMDKAIIPIGYKVLVTEDTRYNGLWTISTLQEDRTFLLTRIQTYRTDLYFDQINWYSDTFDNTAQITYTVATVPDIGALTLAFNDLIHVNNDGTGRFAYYRVQADLTLELIGLQYGTVQIKDSLWDPTIDGGSFDSAVFDNTRFDQFATSEVRSIFEAVYRDIFVKSLSDEFSTLFFLLINYMFTEQKSVDWIFKSSFLTALHNIRSLAQYPSFVKDNQSYYQNYIDEVKPYRTQVREYLLKYDGQDVFSSNITDFDAPGFYDTVTRTYRKPDPANINDTARLSSLPNVLWANNRKLQVSQIVIDNAGVGYVDPPVITIAGGGGRGATAEALINFATGKITSITVTNPGSGYTEKPVIYINGSGARDTGANLIARVGFDGAITWTDEAIITENDVILYDGETYQLANANTSASGRSFVFPDRINGDYVPDRINPPTEPWQIYGTSYDTSVAVLEFNNRYFIANADVINANLFANSVAYFPYANVVEAISSNISFNMGNVVAVDVENQITRVEIVHPGSGFTQQPTVFFEGPGSGANVSVQIDEGSGRIEVVTVLDRGTGYFAGNTNLIVIDPGTSATATARLNNVFYVPDAAKSYNTTRSITEIIKFDRTTYTSNVHLWEPNSSYYLGETVAYGSEAWRANTVLPFANLIYASTDLVGYDNNIWAAANATTSVSGISVTFGNVKYINPPFVLWTDTLTYTANTVVKYGDNYYIGANSTANVSGMTYTFGLRGTIRNANVQPWSNTKTYTTSISTVGLSDVFSYLGNTYILANTVANASGRSFSFPSWSNTVSRAGRINAKVVAWEPDAEYTDMSANTLYEYLGNVYQANTEITNVTITANSPRFFPNANVVKATTSNLTFNYGHVVASTDQFVSFNAGNVILGTPEIIFNFGNARLISNATAITWSNSTYYSSDTIVQYNGNTFIAANVNSSISSKNYSFPAWSNLVPRGSRLKANVVQWQPNTVYDTTSIVVEYLGRIVIANTEITHANLFANSARYFGNANVLRATGSNLTFNTSNLTPINATIYPTVYLGLDTNIAITKGTRIGVLNSTGRAVVEANVTYGNLIFASNTVGKFNVGTGAFLYELDENNSFVTNLGAKVLTVNSVFDVAKYTNVAPAEFDNANDRTMAFYQPRADMPARDLRQLFDGIEYPGVQVQGPRFDSNNTLSTDVLEFFASNQTIKTTNLPAFNFTRQDLLPGQFFTLTGTASNDGQWTIRTQKDNMITVVGANVGQFVQNESAGEMATISFFNQSSPLFLDTVIQSNYVDTAIGLRPEDINIDGGKYVDTYSSHAPQELVPGRVFDSLNMQIYTQMVSGTANVGYRVVHNMYSDATSTETINQPEYFRIREINTAILTQDLLPTDTHIYVDDVNKLPPIGTNASTPGVIYVNGEKITYFGHVLYDSRPWVANVEYANTDVVRYEGVGYTAANANVTLTGTEFPIGNAVVVSLNALTKLQRGSNGTGIPLVHPAGVQVQDSSENQRFPVDAHKFTWLNDGIIATQDMFTIDGKNIVDYRKSNIVARTADVESAPTTVTDGAGLEGSTTRWADFVRQLTGY
jgi:hypothetical protein